MTPSCLLAAWSAHEAELRRYLRHRLTDPDEADDLVHDVFLKACRQGEAFCGVHNPRAWLFEVARNTFLDHVRHARPLQPLPPDLAAAEPDLRLPLPGRPGSLAGPGPRGEILVGLDDAGAVALLASDGGYLL